MPSNNSVEDELETGHQGTQFEEDMGILTEYLSRDILGHAGQTPSMGEEATILPIEHSEDDSDLEELLTRLGMADDMVTGVENRLDKILDKLDDLLIHLDSRDMDRPKTDDPADSGSPES